MKTFKRHILFWTIYGIYFYFINSLSNEEMTIVTCLITIPYFALVYYSLSLILNKYHDNKNIWFLIIRLLIFLSLSFLFVYYLTYQNAFFSLLYGAYLVPNYKFSWSEFLQTYLIMHGHFTLLALLNFHYHGKQRESNQKLEEVQLRLHAEEQRREFEYLALAAQVPPHLLTNIFGLWENELRTTLPVIANQMEKLNEIIRYCMQAHNVNSSKVVLLVDELTIIKDFISLQRTITTQELHVDISTTGDIYQSTLPPTILFTLVENAVKHGNNTQVLYPLNIEVKSKTQSCQIRVSNFKRHSNNIRSHGIGLENLKARLNMVYGEKQVIDIQENNYFFEVSLTIDY